MPNEDQLKEAWDNIFVEFCDMSESSNQTYILQLTREIKYLEWQINIIQAIVDRLQLSFVPELCDVLRDYGYFYEYSPDSMFNDLHNTVNEAKFLVVQLGVKQGEYDKYLASQENKTATEKDYEDILSELSKFQGYHLRSKDLSVSEYVSIFNRFKKQNGG